MNEEETKEEETCSTCSDICSDEENSESHKEIDDIKKIFDPQYAYPLEDVIKELEELGHSKIGTILTRALQDELLYVDSIEDDGTVYLAITEQEE